MPPSELHAEAALEDAPSSPGPTGETATPHAANGIPESYDLLADDGTVLMKDNRLTIDDASRQQLTQTEIEELKKSAGGKEIIEKILANHAGLDEKTAFAKAKYTLRKHKKYLKRFTALPMEVGSLIDYVTAKEPPRIMEMREETLGLIGAWSNVHFSGVDPIDITEFDKNSIGGRWLACDETGGLVVASMADRMGLLYGPASTGMDTKEARPVKDDLLHGAAKSAQESQTNGESKTPKPTHRDFPTPALNNTITLLHPAVQPNLSLLKFFGYDTSSSILPPLEMEHPLHTHLKPLSWLQLLNPEEDPTYSKPEQVAEEILASWKSGKRGNYFKKRRRWERCKSIVEETQRGGFEGVIIASHMDVVTVLENTIPLIRGGGHIVIYSPTLEPLARLVDLFSKERRAAFLAHATKGEDPDKADFPLDPRMLLAPTIQTSRIREWQVLPGRTHPLMTARGGAEGYVFTARRVIPVAGGVEARGNHATKRRKIDHPEPTVAMETPTTANAMLE